MVAKSKDRTADLLMDFVDDDVPFFLLGSDGVTGDFLVVPFFRALDGFSNPVLPFSSPSDSDPPPPFLHFELASMAPAT